MLECAPPSPLELRATAKLKSGRLSGTAYRKIIEFPNLGDDKILSAITVNVTDDTRNAGILRSRETVCSPGDMRTNMNGNPEGARSRQDVRG